MRVNGSSTRTWPRRERRVADEVEPSLLPGKDAGEQTEHGAGVLAVDRLLRRVQPPEPAALDAHDILGRLGHFDAEGAYGSDRGVRVGCVPEAAQLGRPLRDGAEEHSALARSPSRGDSEVADEHRGGLDPHSSSSSTAATTTP